MRYSLAARVIIAQIHLFASQCMRGIAFALRCFRVIALASTCPDASPPHFAMFALIGGGALNRRARSMGYLFCDSPVQRHHVVCFPAEKKRAPIANQRSLTHHPMHTGSTGVFRMPTAHRRKALMQNVSGQAYFAQSYPPHPIATLQKLCRPKFAVSAHRLPPHNAVPASTLPPA